MSLGDLIREARQKAFCTQEEFAGNLGVNLSTVNRWELNKTRPNMKAMKSLKTFCNENSIEYQEIEKEWLAILRRK